MCEAAGCTNPIAWLFVDTASPRWHFMTCSGHYAETARAYSVAAPWSTMVVYGVYRTAEVAA